MRVAALYDIHGNLPALEAVLAELEREPVDAIVVGGDVVPGPMPQAAFDALARLTPPVHYILGNCEVAVLDHIAGRDLPPLPEPVRESMRWTAAQLDDTSARRMASWPKTLRLSIDGLGDVLFCHGTPRNENEIFTRLTPEAVLRPLFDDLGVAVVVCGHTHMQFERTIGTTRVVNAGSVGMPWGDPGADWLVLGPDVRLRHTTYDLAGAAERIRATPFPQAQEFAERDVLHPRSAAEMLELLARAEVK